MKIAVSASGPSLDSEVDPRFGRCQYLLIVDVDSMAFEALENPAVMAPGGAGIQAAQAAVGKGVGAVITGNCGPNAYQVLFAAHVDVLDGVSGSVREAVESYRASSRQRPDRRPVLIQAWVLVWAPVWEEEGAGEWAQAEEAAWAAVVAVGERKTYGAG